MIEVTVGNRPEEVRHEHTLFVEGGDDSLDPSVLGEILRGTGIRIEPMGHSLAVRSVAEALHKYHPTYYFLIDRDHYGDSMVEDSWKNFPDPAKHNLLIWRRRELENYFIDPSYLAKSSFLVGKRGKLDRKILSIANERLFLEVVNLVIISIREELKKRWIELPSNPSDFPNKESALDRLVGMPAFANHRGKVEKQVSSAEIARRFNERYNMMTGGQYPVVFGTGNWLHMIKGKQVLHQLANSDCFKVVDLNDIPVDQGSRVKDLVTNLLRQDLNDQPDDFKELVRLVGDKIANR